MAKKIAIYVFIISFIAFLIIWGVLGIKIFTHDYDITTLTYVGVACMPFIFGSLLVWKYSNAKCPHCGRFYASSGTFCPHCGKKIEK